MEEKFELNGKLPEVIEIVPVCLGDINNSTYKEKIILHYYMTDEEYCKLPNVINIDGHDFYKAQKVIDMVSNRVPKLIKLIEI